MKFNVLVVAAMVITSVNASGHGRFGGLFKQGSDITRSDSEASLLEKKEPPRRGVKQRSSRKSLVHRLGSVFPSKSTRHEPARNLVFKNVKKDPICGPILIELVTSQHKFSDFDIALWKQNPEFYKLVKWKGTNRKYGMKMEATNKDGVVEMSEEEKIKVEALRVDAIRKWLKSNLGAIPDLQKIKAESISLKEDHSEIWERFKGSKCPTEEVKCFSPEGMEKQRHFLEWHDEKGVDILGEQ